MLVRATVVIAGLNKIDSTQTNRDEEPLEALQVIVYLIPVLQCIWG